MTENLFTQALGLTTPWAVRAVRFTPDQHRIDFDVTAQRGACFACPACSATETSIHDRMERSWRHLDFFQYEAFIHAAVPRVKCRACGKVTQVEVPWARPGSHFTLLFEAFMLQLAPHMSVANLARQLRVGDDPLWRVLNHHTQAARAQESYADVCAIGVDETASKRGQSYITVVYDLTGERLIFATEGRGKDSLAAFAEDLKAHGGDPMAIKHVSLDLSAAYQAGTRENLPNAELCFDRFHVVSLANEALEQVRRAEQKTEPVLKGCRWGLLKDPSRWSRKQTEKMHWLQRSNLKSARGWRVKQGLRSIYRTATRPEEAEPLLKRWCSWASRCRLEPFKKMARTVKKHWDGILAGFQNGMHNAKVEAMNRALQEARARARGYR